ncbi:hypothetical protein RIF29_17692 [Crotalaria pallida]|uniref:Uncharacterized protein n=1 Tax=Crotalaria pallida TaxID=3830 RepID=A0AAN9IGP0_CROPI
MVSPSRNQSGGGGKNATVVVEDDKECMEQVGGGEDDGIIITKEEEEKDDDHGDDDEVTPRRKRRRVVTCFCISLTQLVEERRKETGNPNLSEEDVLEEIRDYNDKSIERINNNIPHEKINRPAIPLITLEEAECYLAAKRSRSHPGAVVASRGDGDSSLQRRQSAFGFDCGG